MRRKGIMCLPAVICLLGILLSAPYCRAEAAAVQEIVREKMIPLEDKQLSEKDKTEKINGGKRYPFRKHPNPLRRWTRFRFPLKMPVPIF